MTRRGHSFKRGAGGEIELQINSPRSSPSAADTPSGGSQLAVPEAPEERWLGKTNVRSRVGLGKESFKRQSPVGVGVVDLGVQGRRKIGNFLFFAFCGVCLMLGLVKMFAGGWLGFYGILELGDYEVSGIWSLISTFFFC